MRELSLNEVASLALEVGRGAGFSWGLAEEIARGSRALARRGLPWAEALAGLARDAEVWRAPSPLRIDGWRRRRRDADPATEPLCPVRLAVFLIDERSLLRAGPLRLTNVGAPIWVAALFAASEIAEAFEPEWSGGASTPAADVAISPASTTRAPISSFRRASADPTALAALGEIAARVYVPSSAASRARGAGGGGVDDE